MATKLVVACLLLTVTAISDGKLLPSSVKAVPITEAPWVVTIESSFSSEDSPYLIGSIVSADTILTAAYDFSLTSPSYYFVRAGSNVSTKGGSVHNITNVIVHPTASIHGNNIGLITVHPPFELDETRQPIKLDVDGVKPDGSVATIYAYNDNSKIMTTDGDIVDYDTCEKLMSILGGMGQYPGSNCVLSTGICQSDLGASVVVDNALVGVLSRFIICDDYDFPFLYTDFSKPLIRMWLSANLSK